MNGQKNFFVEQQMTLIIYKVSKTLYIKTLLNVVLKYHYIVRSSNALFNLYGVLSFFYSLNLLISLRTVFNLKNVTLCLN